MNLPTELQEVLTSHGWDVSNPDWRPIAKLKASSTIFRHPTLGLTALVVVSKSTGLGLSVPGFVHNPPKPLHLRVGTRNWKGRICAWMTARVFEAEEEKRQEERAEQEKRERERNRETQLDQLAAQVGLPRATLNTVVREYQRISGDITWYVDKFKP